MRLQIYLILDQLIIIELDKNWLKDICVFAVKRAKFQANIYVIAFYNKIIRQLPKIFLIDMIINKKCKTNEDKNKTSDIQIKKTKKNKNTSPFKSKITPEKKRKKKEQNMQFNKSQALANQKIDMHKSKDNNKINSNNKNHFTFQTKSKLLTTSPVKQEHLKSISNQKKKSKSKSRSTSRINTHRSNQLDKDKSIQKKLYYHNKQNKKEKSQQKSNSKSKSKTKNISPLKQTKNFKQFNVADRQIKYKRSELSEAKKILKKKVHNRLKGQDLLYATDQQVKQIQQPRIKLKKKVPQIKTQFSQRRGSYFDENLLKKLQINHQYGKKAQICPFSHIKSSFQQNILLQNQDIYSKSQMHPSEEINVSSQQKYSQIQIFKKDQQNKWKSMLDQLTKLKNSQKVPQRIDQLIQVLNKNYISLQARATELLKETKVIDQPQSQIFKADVTQEPLPAILQTQKMIRIQEQVSQKAQQNRDDDLSNSLYQVLNNSKKGLLNTQVEREDVLPKLDLEIQHENSFIFDNSSPKSLKKQQNIQQVIIANKFQQDRELIKQSCSKGLQNIPKIQQQEAVIQPQFKRSNNICLSQQFFTFTDSRKQSKLKQEFASLISIRPSQLAKMNFQMIRQLDQHRISDKNLLQELNIFDKSFQTSSNIVTVSKDKKHQFIQQMQEARQRSRTVFDDNSKFNNEIKIHDDLSSQSMLLGVVEDNQNKKRLLDEIESVLFIQFSTVLIKNQKILHNFLSSYSSLVQQNKINPSKDNIATSPISCNNEYINQILSRLLNYLQINYKQKFMQQIQIALQCKPADILKFMRTDEQQMAQFEADQDASENTIQIPFLSSDKIQEFETEILRNQYYIPGYFSFNHSIYDLFNDIFDDLRPYGSKGKSIFTLQIGHKVTKFSTAKNLIIQKFQTIINQKYYQQAITNQVHPNCQGIFEVIYFTCLDVMQQIINQQCIQFMDLFNRKTS